MPRRLSGFRRPFRDRELNRLFNEVVGNFRLLYTDSFYRFLDEVLIELIAQRTDDDGDALLADARAVIWQAFDDALAGLRGEPTDAEVAAALAESEQEGEDL